MVGVNPELLLLQLLNGLALGVLYLLMASGLSVIFGVTEVVNFSHGALYMLGAYVGLAVLGVTGNFWLAIVAAPFAIAVLGMVVERLTLHNIYGRGLLYHIILTFGISLVLISLVELVAGADPRQFVKPEVLSGAASLGPIFYPKYKLFIIAVGLLVTLVVAALFRYTDFGLVVRAGAQSQRTVQILGVDISVYFTLVFGLGSFLAGLAGVLAGPFLSVSPEMGNSILITTFIIVILGGMGSFRGSVLAALLIGVIQSLGNAFVAVLTGFVIYLLMFAVLIVRPEGLLGSYEHRKDEAKLSYETIVSPVAPTDRRFLGVLALLAVLPAGSGLVYPSYYVWLLALMFIWAIFALSLDIVMGYIGLISFGHAAFFGLGAYATALVSIHVSDVFVLGLAAAVVVSAVAAWFVGALSVRLTGIYFALITLAFAQMLFTGARKWVGLTGGNTGLNEMPSPRLLGVALGSNAVVFYYVAAVLMVGLYVLAVRVLNSPFGLAMTAIRESERRTMFLGYDTNKYKRRAFALSGAIGGCAGALLATYQVIVTPRALHWTVSGDVLIAMVFGGMGTLYGPMIGGAVFVGLKQVLVEYLDQWRLVFGVLLVLVVMFAPRGLISIRSALRERLSTVGLPITSGSGGEPEDSLAEPREVDEDD